MKHLYKILVSVLFLVLSVTTINAATVEFKINHENKEYSPNSEIVVPIHINSSDAYNAYTLVLEFENLEYRNAVPADGWTTFNGPTQDGNKITYTAATLGADKYAINDKKVLDLTFKIPSEGTYTLKGNGTIALTDDKATQITYEIPATTYNVGPSLIETIQEDLKNETSMTSTIVRVLIAIAIVVIGFFLFRIRGKFIRKS